MDDWEKNGMTRAEQAVERLKKELEQKEVLEAACGCAEFATAASQIVKTVHGIDLDSTRLLPKAKNCSNLQFSQMDVTAMTFENGSFDTVVLYNAVGHLRTVLEKAVNECFRVLRAGGSLLVISSVKMDKWIIANELIPLLNKKKCFFQKEDDAVFTDIRVSPAEVLRLTEPSMEYEQQIWQFRQEILDAGDQDSFAGCGGGDRSLEACSSAGEWIERVRAGKSAETCPKGRVPSDMYLAVRETDDRLIGIIDLRHQINTPVLSTWGGHIGYSVRPDERGKGYAKEMLRLNLMNCRRLGLQKVMVTCNENNPASEKTILANGGVFEKTVEVDGSRIKRYWILLEE